MPHSKKIDATHSAILKSAYILFMDHGYEETTMDAIAQHAGVSRKTVFNHFNSKDTLLTEIAFAWHRGNRKFRDEAENLPDGPVLPMLRERLLSRLKLLNDSRDFMMLVLTHTKAYELSDTLIPIEALADSTNPNLHEIYSLFLQAQTNGELREPISAETAYRAYIALRNMIVLRWSSNPDNIALQNEVSDMLELLFRGIAKTSE